jgi:hypothetical protein
MYSRHNISHHNVISGLLYQKQGFSETERVTAIKFTCELRENIA